MQATVDIGFHQLLHLLKGLPAMQWERLKQEVEAAQPVAEDAERARFRELLLNGPTFTEEQLRAVASAREAIDRWRED
jgi:hypothetical protein